MMGSFDEHDSRACSEYVMSGRYVPAAPGDKLSAICCSRCGERLPVKIVAEVSLDLDFVEHGDHLAAWEPTAENFAEARRCAEVCAR